VSRIALIVGLGLFLAACQPEGTYVVIEVDQVSVPPTPIVSVDLQLRLNDRTAQHVLVESDRRPLQFPTDVLLKIAKGTGSLDVSAVGRDAGDMPVLKGGGSVVVSANSVAHVKVKLGELGSTPGAVLAAMPTAGDFGKVVVGNMSADITFDITNSGTAASDPLGATISGPDAAMFHFTSMDCVGKAVPAGGGCKLGVQFSPTQSGARMAQIDVSGGGGLTIRLGGEGIPPGAFTATPPSGSFMQVPIAGMPNYGDILFMIQNSGGATTGTLSTSIEGTDKDKFAIMSDSCAGTTLAGGSSCMLTVRFAPGTRGAKTATLMVQATPGGLLPVSLGGSGQAPALLAISPSTTTLATAVDVGSSGNETASLTVSNSGDVPGVASISATDSTNFAITDGCGGATLPAGGTCTVKVALKPESAGAKSTTVSLANGVMGMDSAVVNGIGRDQLQLSVAVKGNGAGTVSAAAGVEGAPINCTSAGGTCSQHYYRTTSNPVVTLNASYDSTAVTASWSAPCATSTTKCDVTLDAAKTVTVTFSKKTHTLTITRTTVAGGATGTVTGSGLNCGGGGSCAVTVDHGAQIVLTASPTSGYFSQWVGCTSSVLQCTTSPITADTTVEAQFSIANLIFVTSGTYSVTDLQTNGGGNAPTGADNYCKTAGAAFPNRKFTSLLTTGSNNVATRLGSSRGWVRPDGKPFGDMPSSFVYPGRKVFYPPALDEHGNVVTGTELTHAASGSGCVDWTSSNMSDYHAGGVATAGGYGWDVAFGSPCVYSFHLYCMSTDYVAVVTPPAPTSARIAFISDGVFNPGTAGSGGLDGATKSADALCQSEASTNGLTGTFVAFMASNNPLKSAISRITNLNGLNWMRPDGVMVTSSPSSLNTTTPALLSSIQVSASKQYYGNEAVYTGANEPTQQGTAGLTCTPSGGRSWTAGSAAGVAGRTGQAYSASSRFFYDYYDDNCAGQRIYCFQQ